MVELLRGVTQAGTLDIARTRLGEAVEASAAQYPRLAALVDEQGEEMLAVYGLPEAHRRRMRSTNLLERFHQEVKRRTRVVRIFPDEASCLRLVTALAMEASEEWLERRYPTMPREQTQDDHQELVKAVA